MKKFLSLALALIMALAMFAGCAQQGAENPPPKKRPLKLLPSSPPKRLLPLQYSH